MDQENQTQSKRGEGREGEGGEGEREGGRRGRGRTEREREDGQVGGRKEEGGGRARARSQREPKAKMADLYRKEKLGKGKEVPRLKGIYSTGWGKKLREEPQVLSEPEGRTTLVCYRNHS